MRMLVWPLFGLLIVVQQDWTGWCRVPAIVLGFVPQAVAVQAAVSIAAAALWWWAVTWCWPAGLDDPADAAPGDGRAASGGAPAAATGRPRR
jgi:hypothetical protein